MTSWFGEPWPSEMRALWPRMMPLAGVSAAAVKPCARRASYASGFGLNESVTSYSGFIVDRPEPGPVMPGSSSLPGAPRKPGLPAAVAPVPVMLCVIVVEIALASVTYGSMNPA